MISKADVILQIFEEKLPQHYDTSIVRKSQVQMALDIGEFLESNKQVFIIEAPVGTGKSLGVLVPALVDKKYSIYNPRSIMYATATINLQGQLMESEIPLLNSIGLVKKPIVAKGKPHYYCHFRLKDKGREKLLFSPKDKEILEKFYQTSETGQRSELEGKFGFDIEDEKWKKVELPMNSNCRDCPLSGACPTIAHRRRFRAIENDVVITNHDQLISSFLNAMDVESIYEPVLKTNMGVVVIDEAHDFLETFIGRLEKTFTLSYLKYVEKYIDRDKYKWGKALEELKKWIKQINIGNEKSDTGRFMLNASIIYILKELQEIINENLYRAKFKKAEILDELSGILNRFLQKSRYTSWVSLEDGVFHVVENNYKEVFRRMLDYIIRANKVIFMSGTLTVNGDFSYIINQWGIRFGEALTKVLDSPFDYKNQALIYIPEGLGDPNKDEFIEKALKKIHRLLQLTGGRTLLLNTSKHHMDNIYTGIKDKLDDAIPLYKQGDSGVEKLTKRFKQSEESVLIGSGSFFSGFSVAGTSLTSVILNKLPFPAFNDPIVELIGRGITEKEMFNKVRYPIMANKLDQAVGRLIRSIEDYGIVTILDERVYTSKVYGEDVQELLKAKGFVLTRSWDEVESFYIRKLKNGAEANYKLYDRKLVNIGNILSRPNRIIQVKKVKKKNPGKITKSQESFLEKVCRTAGFMIILKGSTELVFKEVCRSLHMKNLQVAEIMKDFPYRNTEEKEELRKYLAQGGTGKRGESVFEKFEEKKTTKKLNKEQREFLKSLITQEALSISLKREVTYMLVYDELYRNWKDVSYLREFFPYKDEEEKRELSTYHGGTRKRVYPLCTKLGCSGICSENEHKKIDDYLIKTYGATRVSYIRIKGNCRIQVEPTEILDQDEFRPDELLQTI
jgi:ATP-dependent DNA helicase DinG